MLSKADSRKKPVGNSGTKLLDDLEAINTAFYADKTLQRLASSTASSRSKSVGKLQMPDQTAGEDAKHSAKNSSEKDKKSSIWSWKGLKALTHIRNRRFTCCFSLLVHSIENLPATFDNVSLVVHWKRRDSNQMTCPVRVLNGVAKFEEQLSYSCSVYGSRSGPHHSAKYEAKHFLLYASVCDSSELDLGKHRVDLTRLLPLTLEELVEEKSSGMWTTSFRLSGRARGGIMHASFGYVVTDNNSSNSSIAPCCNTNVPEMLITQPNRSRTAKLVDPSVLKDDSIFRGASIPSGWPISCEPAEDKKDAHEVLPAPRKELCDPVHIIYQKVDEVSSSGAENKVEINALSSPINEKNCGSKCETPDLSVIDEVMEKLPSAYVQSEIERSHVAQGSGNDSEIDGYGKVNLEEDAFKNSADVNFVNQNDEQSISISNGMNAENDFSATETLMKELEAALSSTSDLVDGGLDSEDETDALQAQKYLEVKSSFNTRGSSLNMADDSDLVASDFLEMLGIMESPSLVSSESEPDSPRERLLREFEKDALANGGLLNFDFDDNTSEFLGNTSFESERHKISEEPNHSSIFEDFGKMPQMEVDPDGIKTRASRIENLETEALMRAWGLTDEAFKHSPPSVSGGVGCDIGTPFEDPLQLPPIADGLGHFVQTKDGGFLRSMSPALFRNSKSGGSLVMQVSNPVVVPAELGSGVMDILQSLASVGIEKLSMQANKLMPLEEITGKTIQQLAREGTLYPEGPESQDSLQQAAKFVRTVPIDQKGLEGNSPVSMSSKFDSSSLSKDTEYVSLEDLAPLAVDKIEALSIEGLRIQSGMSDGDAPLNISTQSIGELSALEGKTIDAGGSLGLDGSCGLQLMHVKDNGEDIDGLMGLSLTLDEWMKLDSGEVDDGDVISERTTKLLAAHHATSLDQFRGRSQGEKRRGRRRKYGLLGNNFTVALMVQLRDPLRYYEPVGAPMLALIQVERVLVPPKPKVYSIVSLITRDSKEAEEAPSCSSKEDAAEMSKNDDILEESVAIPQFKITEVHVSGLNMDNGKKKLWGSKNQQQAGSRWLLANGMGKKNKLPLMKQKVAVKSSDAAFAPMTTTAQPGDKLWSISSRVHGTGAKWKELAKLNPHIRNPNIILHNEVIKLR